MTKKYIAYATMSVALECEFEIEEGQEPFDVALSLDGGLFNEIPNSGEWNIYNVREVTE